MGNGDGQNITNPLAGGLQRSAERAAWRMLRRDLLNDEKRTPAEWNQTYGIYVHSADGWQGDRRGNDFRSYDEPITLREYSRRLTLSSCTAKAGAYERLHQDLQ
jgi:hypothetical protein